MCMCLCVCLCEVLSYTSLTLVKHSKLFVKFTFTCKSLHASTLVAVYQILAGAAMLTRMYRTLINIDFAAVS